jgi:predicted transcriptional regulator
MKILLSIKPEYSEKIFSGEKKFEFRKKKPIKPIEKVFVYESRPSKHIAGWFTIKKVITDSPESIWHKCKNKGGIREKNYFEYCNGNKIIHALEIDNFHQFECPINPLKTNPNFKPPQNFSYLENSVLSNELEL